jgi:protein-disulfide isomerase
MTFAASSRINLRVTDLIAGYRGKIMNIVKFSALFSSILWLTLTANAATGGSEANETVAVVGGQPILARDLDAAVKSQIAALRNALMNQEFQIKNKALDDLIRQRVLDVEAARQGLTVEQLFAREVDAHIPTPIDAEAYAYYLGNRSQVNKPFKEVRAQMQAALKALEIKQMRDDYVDYLRAKADVSIRFHQPRTEVSFDRGRLRGDPKAPVTIVEFADYQCPYCEKVEATIQELLKKYPGKVKVAFRDFPLAAIHPNAQKAAEAVRCAGQQGRFWEFHDVLFAAQAKLDEPGLRAEAHTLGLDEKAFSSCLQSAEVASQVARDQEDGKNAGITSTPGFFINGLFLNGAQPVAEFEKLIDNELKLAAQAGDSGSAESYVSSK